MMERRSGAVGPFQPNVWSHIVQLPLRSEPQSREILAGSPSPAKHCRRPRARSSTRDPPKAICSSSGDASASDLPTHCAYVVLLYGVDMEYALGALLVANSLRRSGARARVLLLHTADVPTERLGLLSGVRGSERPLAFVELAWLMLEGRF